MTCLRNIGKNNYFWKEGLLLAGGYDFRPNLSERNTAVFVPKSYPESFILLQKTFHEA